LLGTEDGTPDNCHMDPARAHHTEKPEKVSQAMASRFLRPYMSLSLKNPTAKPELVSTERRHDETNKLI